MQGTIVVIDDDSFLLKWLTRMLKVAGYDVVPFEKGKVALESILAAPPRLVICDLFLEDTDGFAILSELREKLPLQKTIMMTASTDLSPALKAMRLGAFDYVTKPIDPEFLLETISRAMQLIELEEANKRHIDEIARRDEALQQELQLARIIISDILPSRYPRTKKLEFGTAYIPAGEIGGDYYDFIQFREPNRVGIVISDISGKGVPAALLMTMFKLRANEVFRSVFHPAECMSVLNRTLSRDFPPDHFVSATYVVIDSDKGELTYTKAAQDPCLLLKPGKEPILLDRGSGFALAAFDPETFGESPYTQHTVSMEPGDTLFLFTDGLIEIEDKVGRRLKLDGLLNWIKEDESAAPEIMVKNVVEKAKKYVNGDHFQDDMTIVAARFKP